MAQNSGAGHLLRFGVFEMDLRTGELRKSGTLIHLSPQPYKVLALLASKPGKLVTQNEIREQIWGDSTFVDYEQGLRASIKKIRAALGDSSESPRYIETLSRRGYRFIAPVESWPATAHSLPALGSVTSSTSPMQPQKRSMPSPWLLAGGAVAVIALVMVGLNLAGSRYWLASSVTPSATPEPGIQTIAVLPIENVSGDPGQDFFCAGLTDALTTDLAEGGVPNVISRTSVTAYAGKGKPLPEIARELHVDAVVEGTAMRFGGRVRITAQLIDARRDRSLWAGTFEGPATNLLLLEDNATRQIAAYISSRVASEAQSPQSYATRSINPAAQNAYWHGRYLFDRRRVADQAGAVDDFRKAIRIDPEYAQAYAGLAQALLSASYLQAARAGDIVGEARDAVHHALRLNPNLSEAYCALGMIQGTYDYDWKAAQESLRRSIDLNPSNPIAEIFLSAVLISQGRTQEALGHARRALQLDPLSFFANRNLGSTLYFARRYDQALRQFQQTRAVALQNRPGVIDNWISWTYAAEGKYDDAVEWDLKVLAASGTKPAQIAHYRAAYQHNGWKGYWKALLRDRPRRMRGTPTNGCFAYQVALAELRVGSKIAAMGALNQALSQRCIWVIWLKADPKLDAARNDPRFASFLARLHLSL